MMKNTDFSKYLAMTPKQLRIRQLIRGLPITIVGAIIFAVLYLCGQRPKNYKGIWLYFEIGDNWGGVSFGWFFICCKNSGEATKRHESGHLIQAATFNGWIMLILSIGSAIRYWWRKIFGAKTPYDSWWFESQATKVGAEYVRNIKNENKE